jgi:sec-independent protein translocase protein TatC
MAEKDDKKLEDSPVEEETSTDTEEENDEEELGNKMSFINHLEELWRRIIVSLLTFGMTFIAVLSILWNNEEARGIFTRPLEDVLTKVGSHLIATGIPESFFFIIKVSAVAAVFLASPMILYQIWAFVAPGLYKKERKHFGPLVFFSFFLFAAGAAFFYFVVFPIVANFFVQFAIPGKIEWTPKLSETFSFVTMTMFAFGLAFELPVVAFILARLNIINASFLNKNRKYAILIMIIGAAFFTPPDVVSQLLLAAPMWILFEISVIIAWIFGPKSEKEEESE